MEMLKFTGVDVRKRDRELLSTHEQGYVIKYARQNRNSMARYDMANTMRTKFCFASTDQLNSSHNENPFGFESIVSN